ncbi:WhiB family transcriptional regulator [Streptomyces javensis]|uniref:WhiB family transcriptional regulator n=1 Tax=Streptomyces javensis TaxID=114698 RepID=A0ABS0RCF4_9ACTN|nr:WhiB family transcriptional regulator [Streptomyces javensis]MBI0314740.1 WhiB family transcriptional regulator [Streptomyces javensis]
MTPAAVLAGRPASAEGSHWAQQSACHTTNADDFFGPGPAARARAREICLSCPVRVACLTDRAADGIADTEGMVGGLDEAQRRVLKVAELIGERPDLERAEQLLSPSWRYRLHKLRNGGYAPRRMAEILTGEGLTVDAITVRVALWWIGASGKALARRASRDRRPLWQRLHDDHADEIRRLRGSGARHIDVAEYLGVHVGTSTRAVQSLEVAA